MPFAKGHKLAKGRPKGSPNKRVSVWETCEEMGLDPFKEMARIAGDRADPNQFNALKELAQYLEPKKKAVEMSGNLDTRVVQAVEGLMSLSQEELRAIAEQELKGLKK